MVSPNSALILVIEDDEALARLVSVSLSREGYRTAIVSNGDDAVERILQLKPDLVLLDIMLPGKDGFSICKEVRGAYQGPIIIVTARDDDMDELMGFENGGDDYVRKPVHPRILLARIAALLRRARPPIVRTITSGAMTLSTMARTVHVGGVKIDLSTAEYDLLYYLVRHAGRILSRDELYQELRGISFNGMDRAIDLRISKIRMKLQNALGSFQPIRTVHGQGYLFVEND